MNKPPKLAKFLLKILSSHEKDEAYLGDIEELFFDRTESLGPWHSRRWYWWEVIKSIPKFFQESLRWRFVMLKNYIKITLRNFRRQKIYSFINIIGLAIGIACCLFITIWVVDELSFDRFHKDIDNIYHVLTHMDVPNILVTPTLLAPTLKERFPEIVEAARLHWFFQATILSHGDKKFYENRLRLVDPSFFSLFNFPFLKGNPDTALNDPHSIVISEEIAKKYFGTEDPMEKVLTLNNQHEKNCRSPSRAYCPPIFRGILRILTNSRHTGPHLCCLFATVV